MKSKSSLFIIIVVVLLIGGGLVYFFMSKNSSSTETVPPAGGLISTNTGRATGTTVAATGTTTGDQVVSLLRNLSTIQLNDAIFQNPSFAMLQDISITLQPVTSQGRRNPFAVVGNDSGIQGTITTPAASSTGTEPSTGPATGQ